MEQWLATVGQSHLRQFAGMIGRALEIGSKQGLQLNLNMDEVMRITRMEISGNMRGEKGKYVEEEAI